MIDYRRNNCTNSRRRAPRPHVALFIAISFALLLCHTIRADEIDNAHQTAVLVGGGTVEARLTTIEANGDFRFATSSDERIITKETLVRWGHPAQVAQRRVIVLAEGSEISADEWAIGIDDATMQFAGEELTFAPSLFERVSLPRHMLRAVVLRLPGDAAERDHLFASIRTRAADEDAIFVSGGDRLAGRVTLIDSQHARIETASGPIEAPLSGVDAVVFDSPLIEPSPDTRDRTLVGLSDGSLLAVREFAREGDQLVLKLDGGIVLRGAAVENVVALQPLGQDVRYLSDMEPLRYVHVPYLDLTWPLGRDTNVMGGRLRTGGKLFWKGLGVHSAARLVYRLDGTHQHFAALAAIDDSAARGGSVIVRVLLAEGDAWREAYTSPVTRGGDEPVPIFVSVGQAKGLALVVDYADRGDELDHANWLDARLE